MDQIVSSVGRQNMGDSTSRKVPMALPPLTAEQGMRVVNMVAGASLELGLGELKNSLEEEGVRNRAAKTEMLRSSLAAHKNSQFQRASSSEFQRQRERPPEISVSEQENGSVTYISNPVKNSRMMSPGTLFKREPDDENPTRAEMDALKHRAELMSNKVAPLDVEPRPHHHAKNKKCWPLAEAAGLDPDKYNERALGFLTLDWKFRIWAIKFAEWKWFDRIILAVIFTNSAFLAAYDPLDLADVNPTSSKRNFLDTSSIVFTWIFIFEFLVKVFASGFIIGPHSYLSSSWNWLDFTIVAASVFDLVPGTGGSNLSAIRTFRVMRPLRAITRFKNLRFLVRLLLKCIPMLMNVVGLCFFIFFVFGILGVQLWSGQLRNRCYSNLDGTIMDTQFLCSSGSTAFHVCPDGYTCLPLYDNPHYGATHFDSILGAILTIFQVMTYEGWTISMYLVMDGFSALAVLYFVLLIFVGPIFAVQLFLVVISNKFVETKTAESMVDDFGASAVIKMDSDWSSNPMIQKSLALIRGAGSRVKDSFTDFKSKFSWIAATKPGAALVRIERRMQTIAESKFLADLITGVIIVNTVFMAIDHDCDLEDRNGYCHDFSIVLESANLVFTAIFTAEMIIKWIGLGIPRYLTDTYNVFDALIVAISLAEVQGIVQKVQCLVVTNGREAYDCDGGGNGLSVLRTFRLVRVLKLLRAFPSLQRQIRIVVNLLSSVSALLVLILILLGIFSILGMNLFGGNWNPIQSSADIYLGSRIILQVPGNHLFLQARIQDIDINSNNGMNYFVKLLFCLPDGTTTLWASLSTELPPNAHQPTIVGYVPRQNFDSLLYALLTSLQILTQEDWEFIYFTTSRTHGMWSAIYFVALIVIGNYMMLNLFIAIIIQGFSGQPPDSNTSVASEESAFFLALLNLKDIITWKISNFVANVRRKFSRNKGATVAPESDFDDESTDYGPDVSPFPLEDADSVAWEAAQPHIKTTRSRLTMGGFEDDYDNASYRSHSPSESILVSGIASPIRRSGSVETMVDLTVQVAPNTAAASPLVDPSPGASVPEIFSRMDDLRKDSAPQMVAPQPSEVSGESREPTVISDLNSPGPFFDSSVDMPSSVTMLQQALQQKKLAFANSTGKKVPVVKSSGASPATSVTGDPDANLKSGAASVTSVNGDDDEEVEGRSLFCLGRRNPLRTLAFRMISSKIFDNIILFCIFLSCVALAMERPGIVGFEKKFLEYLNLALNCAFIVEMMIKVTALNFIVYFSSHWNKLDLFIVVTSIIDFIFEQASGGRGGLSALRILRIFRIFRALRPLRVISRARGLKIVLLSITGSVKPVLNTLFIAGMVFLVFGILGVQLFGGKMRYCTDNLVSHYDDCHGFSSNGTPRRWVNQNINFDNIGEAILTMFMLAAVDGWPAIMWTGVDATSKFTGPTQGFNELVCLYYVVCLVVTGFLVINIFVGVFVDNFNTAAQRVNASLKLRVRSRKRKVLGIVEANNPDVPIDTDFHDNDKEQSKMNLRLLLVKIVTQTEFDILIACCIALNVITMAFESYTQSYWQENFLAISNYLFTYIFALEAVMKLFAFRPKLYFMSNWNRFDFTIVMISFIGIAVEESGSTIGLNPTILRVLRVFRIFRILRAFRIFKAAKGLQAIIDTLFKSLPAIGNLAGMLGLLFFIFGILCVELFGTLCVTDDYTGLETRCKLVDPSDLLDSHASFRNVPLALLSLFRIATGDNWGDIMNACKLGAGPRPDDYAGAIALAKSAIAIGDWPTVRQLFPGCQSQNELIDLGVDCAGLVCESNCGSRIVASILYAAFLAMSNFVLLNLVIAVLMQQLAESENMEDMVNERLSRATLARIYWRWRINARVYTARCIPQAAPSLVSPPPLGEQSVSTQQIYMRRRASIVGAGGAGTPVAAIRRMSFAQSSTPNTGDRDGPAATPTSAFRKIDNVDSPMFAPNADKQSFPQPKTFPDPSPSLLSLNTRLEILDDEGLNSRGDESPKRKDRNVTDGSSRRSSEDLPLKPPGNLIVVYLEGHNLPGMSAEPHPPVVNSQATIATTPRDIAHGEEDDLSESLSGQDTSHSKQETKEMPITLHTQMARHESVESGVAVESPQTRHLPLRFGIIPPPSSRIIMREAWLGQPPKDPIKPLPPPPPAPSPPPLLTTAVVRDDQDIAADMTRTETPSPTSWDAEEAARLMTQKFVAATERRVLDDEACEEEEEEGEDFDEDDGSSDGGDVFATMSNSIQHPSRTSTKLRPATAS